MECTPLASSYWVKPKMQVTLSASLTYHMTVDLTKLTFGDPAHLCWEMKIINNRLRFSRSFVCWSEVTMAEDTLNLKWFGWTGKCSALRRQYFVLCGHQCRWGQRLCVNRSRFRVWLEPSIVVLRNIYIVISCEWHLSSASRQIGTVGAPVAARK